MPVALIDENFDRHHAVIHHRYQPLVMGAHVVGAFVRAPEVGHGLGEHSLHQRIDLAFRGVKANDSSQLIRVRFWFAEKPNAVRRIAVEDQAASPAGFQRA